MKNLANLLFALALFCTSCIQAQYYYHAPSGHNPVTFSRKGDWSAYLGLARSNDFSGVDVNFGRAFGQHWLISGAFTNLGSQDIRKLQTYGAQLRKGEVNGGLYEKTWLGTSSLLIGASFGDLLTFYTTQAVGEFRMLSYYIQPALFFSKKNLQYGLSLRMSRLQYEYGEVSLSVPNEELYAILAIEGNGAFFLPEIGFNAALKLGNFRLGGYCAYIFSDVDVYHFSRTNLTFTLGYQFSAPEKKGKTQTKRKKKK